MDNMDLDLYRRQFYERVVDSEATAFFKDIEAWVSSQRNLRMGRGEDAGSDRNLHIIHRPSQIRIMRLKDSGTVEIDFESLMHSPAFAGLRARESIRKRLQTVPGIAIADVALSKYPALSFRPFSGGIQKIILLDTLEWIATQVDAVKNPHPA